MNTENCVIHTFLKCHFKLYVQFRYLSNIKHDRHNIRIMFYDYKYAILLDKLKKMGTITFLFEFGYIILRGGGGKSPLPFDIFASDIPYIHIHVFYIALLSYTIAYIQNIILKGNMLKRKQ